MQYTKLECVARKVNKLDFHVSPHLCCDVTDDIKVKILLNSEYFPSASDSRLVHLAAVNGSKDTRRGKITPPPSATGGQLVTALSALN